MVENYLETACRVAAELSFGNQGSSCSRRHSRPTRSSVGLWLGGWKMALALALALPAGTSRLGFGSAAATEVSDAIVLLLNLSVCNTF
jgi:hypothetical protein